MNKKLLYVLWAGLFVLCAGLGLFPEPEGILGSVLTALSLAFFLPPALLLWQCRKSGDRKGLRLIRNLSLISLGATLVLLMANILSLLAPEAVGNILYYALVVVSTPMVCGQYWFVSLLLWAILLWCSLIFLREIKK